MIDFYTYPTINGQAVHIMLAASGLPYQLHLVDLMRAEQQQESFKKINPSGRIPVIVDHELEPPLVLSQTHAILLYLAEKTGQFLPTETRVKAHTLQWLQFIATDIGPNVFNNFYLKALIKPPQPQAADFLKQRALNFCLELEKQLSQNPYISGSTYSIADMVALPIIHRMQKELSDDQSPNLSRWYQQLMSHDEIKQVFEKSL